MSQFLDIPIVGIGSPAQDLADIYTSTTHRLERIDPSDRWVRPSLDIDLSIDHVRKAALVEYRNLCGSTAADPLEDFGAEVAARAPHAHFNLTSAECDWYCEEVYDYSEAEWNDYVARTVQVLETPARLRPPSCDPPEGHRSPRPVRL